MSTTSRTPGARTLPAEAGDTVVASPPPPHDPADRDLLGRVGEWEVRVFAATDPKYDYFVRRGFLHLQLWHPRARVSVLTPSRLTLGRYEIFPLNGWKLPETDLDEVAALLHHHHGINLPSRIRLRTLEQWFVHATLRRERRIRVEAAPA